MDKTAIGRRLRDLRGDKTQTEVSRDLGISASALTMYEAGNRIPRDEIKVMIAKYYGKSVEDIFFAENCHAS